MLTLKADVVIAGVRLAGLVAAWESLERGRSVLLLDRDQSAPPPRQRRET